MSVACAVAVTTHGQTFAFSFVREFFSCQLHVLLQSPLMWAACEILNRLLKSFAQAQTARIFIHTSDSIQSLKSENNLNSSRCVTMHV